MDPVFVPDPEALDRALAGATAADVVLLVQQGLRAGSPASLLALCEAAARRGLRDPALTLTEATVRVLAGEPEHARRLVAAVLAESPDHLGALSLGAHLHAAAGDRDSALALLGRVIERFPDHPGAQASVARLLFPGAHYRDVLVQIHRTLRPKTYLEIGVETGATLALAVTADLAVGIDPADAPLTVPLRPNARLHRTTSDAFFESETPETALAGARVDLAFIDGMHWFEYALRDFANVERWSSPGGTIVIHDCLPATRIAARRERASTFWVGDVWKLLEVLVLRRSDLKITVVPAPPSGLVVVRRLDPRSTVLRDEYDAILRSQEGRDYPHVPGAWPAAYHVVSNDAAGLARALA